MSNTLPTIALLAASAAAPAAAAPAAFAGPPVTTARVSEVVLYRDRARVTRMLEVAAGARGTVEIVLDDLPRRLVPESLRVEVDGGVAVKSVAHRIVPARPSDAPPWARRIEDRQAAIAIELDMLAKQSEVLDALGAFSSRALPAELDRGLLQAGEVTNLALFSFEHRERLSLRAGELEREARHLAAERAELATGREATVLGDGEPRNVAVVRLGQRGPGPLSARLEYLVDGVGWEPSYRVRGSSADRIVELAYHASVRQDSGEDWRDAMLTLVPAPAPRRARAPRLDALALEQVRSGTTGAAGPGGAAVRQLAELTTVLTPGPADEGPAAPSRDSLRPIEIGRVSLASRAEPRTLPLLDLRLEGEHYRVAVPLAAAEVYREASVRNDTDDALPAGPILAYFDGAFVGAGRIAGVAPGEAFTLGLGADPSLRASRRLLSREERLVGDQRRVTARYRLALENRSGAPLSLRLLDRVPAASEESGVRVALEPLAVPLHEPGAVAGVLRWDVEVPAGAAAPWTLDYGLVVEFDRGFQLSLDRDAALPAPAPSSPTASVATGWRLE